MRIDARAALALLIFATVGPATAAMPLTPLEEHGRRLYRDGVAVSGAPITARMAGATNALAGMPVACGNCHGEDGRGRAESGVDPGDVTWTELTKPYGHAHANGRRHGPFDAMSLARAVNDGIDPGGNAFSPAMPRYSASTADLEALVAYLERIDRTFDRGLSDTTIRIGTLLPSSGRMADAGSAVRRVLAAYFDAVNGRGGVHGRKLLLVVEARGDDPDAARAAARRLVAAEDVFALLAPVSAQIERDLAEAADAAQVPVVGPLTLYPEDTKASSANVFHLLSGVPELADVLGMHAHPTLALSGRPVALLHAAGSDGSATAAAVEAHLRERGYANLYRVPLGPETTPAAIADAIAAKKAAGILVLAPTPVLTDVAKVLARGGTPPQWLIPAPLLPRDVLDWPAAYQGRITVAYPVLAGDRTAQARAELDALLQDDGAPRPYLALQAQAYSAAVVLVEGLSRSGRELSRKKLVAALEGLSNFEPGLVPRVTYNADRRIGALGGYPVAVDLAARDFRPVGGFLRLQ